MLWVFGCSPFVGARRGVSVKRSMPRALGGELRMAFLGDARLVGRASALRRSAGPSRPPPPPLSVRPAVGAVRSVILGDVFGVGFLLAAPDSRKHPVYEISDILGTSVGSALPVVQEGLTNRRRRRRRRRPTQT